MCLSGHDIKTPFSTAERALTPMRSADEVCKKNNVEWVNMSRGKFVEITDKSRLVLKHIHIPEILTRTELITIPVMKTHNKTVITGAIKNQWGCLQELRHNFHLVLSEALVDVNAIVRLRFAQPICGPGFSKHIPAMQTPIRNLSLTDSYQLHPHDRTISGSSFLGQKAATLILNRDSL
jgi:hypothetical protein